MTLDFFIRLTLATHKVAEILPSKEPFVAEMKSSANKLLADLVLLMPESSVGPEQKRTAGARAIKELGIVVAYVHYARRMTQANAQNFVVLEQEYAKVGEFLRNLHMMDSGDILARSKELLAPSKEESPYVLPQDVRNIPKNTSEKKADLSQRQTRILELLRNKEKVQVWELQKVLPQVTKRTLRRDLDDLLGRNLIVRQGEWNEVFYQIR